MRGPLAQTLPFKPKTVTTDQDDRDRWWAKAQRLLSIQAEGQPLSEREEGWLAMIRKESWFRSRRELEDLRASPRNPTEKEPLSGHSQSNRGPK